MSPPRSLRPRPDRTGGKLPAGALLLVLLLIAGTFEVTGHDLGSSPTSPGLVPLAAPLASPERGAGPLVEPQVVVQTPSNGTIITSGAPVTVTWWVEGFNLTAPNGSSNSPGTGHVDVLVDGELFESVWETTPLVLPLADGAHSIALVLVQNSGAVVDPQVRGFLDVECTHGPTTGIPQIVIWTPANGASIGYDEITLSFYIVNFAIVPPEGQSDAPNEGHIHAYLDSYYFAMITVEQAFLVTGLGPGEHTLVLLLVNNDHTPYMTGTGSSEITASTTFNVTGSGGGSYASPSQVAMLEDLSIATLGVALLALIAVVLSRGRGGASRDGTSAPAQPSSTPGPTSPVAPGEDRE